MKIRGYRAKTHGASLVTVVDDLGDESVLVPAALSRYEVRHSPDGFQWGYRGSGPAELARAILVRVVPDDDRARHPACYQTFKEDVLAKIQRDEFALDFKIIREWFETWLINNDRMVDRGWTKLG